MKKYKNSITILLVFAFCVIFVSSAFAKITDNTYTEQDKLDYAEITSLMKALDVIDEESEYSMDTTITRGELIEIIVRFTNGGTDDSISREQAISEAVSRGILSGDENGDYRLENDVLFEEAVKCMVVGLGFSFLAKQYPYDYISIANEKHLLDNVGGTVGTYLTRYRMIKLLYNMLNAEIFVRSADENKMELSYVLPEIFNAKRFKGVVTSVSDTPLFNQKAVSDNAVMIDDTVYETDMDCSKYLGQKVECYSLLEENRLLFMGFDYDNNNVIGFDDVDIEKFENYTYYYTINGVKQKQAHLSNGFYLIYNGYAASEFNKNNLVPKIGTVKLIDNNNDNKYDVAVVWDYKVMKIQSADATKERIFFENADALDSSIYGEISYSIQGSREIDIADLKQNDFIYIAPSIKSERLYIGALRNRVEGKVESVDFDNNNIFSISIDGKTYKSIALFYQDEAPKAGESYSFVLDDRNRVVAYENAPSVEGVYGYLTNVYETADGDSLIFKIFTATGEFNKFSGKEKITVDGSVRKNKNEILSSLKKNAGAVQSQLIKYSTDSEGSVFKIDTAYNFCFDESGDYYQIKSDSTDVSQFRVLYSSRLKGEGTKKYMSSGNSFSDKASIDAGTVIFCVPSNVEAAEDDDYTIGNLNMFKNEKNYSIEAYSEKENEMLATAMLVLDNGVTNATEYAGVVKKMIYTIDSEGEPVTKMEIQGPGGVDMNCLNYNIKKIEGFSGKNPGEHYDVSVGDILWCNIVNGKLKTATMIYDYETDTYISTDRKYGQEHYFALLNIYDNTDGYLGLTAKELETEGENITRADLMYFNSSGYSKAIVESDSKVTVTSGSFNDAPSYKKTHGEYGKVFVYNSAYWPWLMVYYK